MKQHSMNLFPSACGNHNIGRKSYGSFYTPRGNLQTKVALTTPASWSEISKIQIQKISKISKNSKIQIQKISKIQIQKNSKIQIQKISKNFKKFQKISKKFKKIQKNSKKFKKFKKIQKYKYKFKRVWCIRFIFHAQSVSRRSSLRDAHSAVAKAYVMSVIESAMRRAKLALSVALQVKWLMTSIWHEFSDWRTRATQCHKI